MLIDAEALQAQAIKVPTLQNRIELRLDGELVGDAVLDVNGARMLLLSGSVYRPATVSDGDYSAFVKAVIARLHDEAVRMADDANASLTVLEGAGMTLEEQLVKHGFSKRGRVWWREAPGDS